jgi:hypothetical protein
MPCRDSHPRRRAVLVVLVALFVAFSALPAHALPAEQPAAHRSFLSLLQNLRGWLVGMWAGEGMLIDPNGNPTGGPPSGNVTTTGDEGMTVDPHG